MLLQDRPAERVRHRERAIRGKRDAIESRGDGVRIGDTPVHARRARAAEQDLAVRDARARLDEDPAHVLGARRFERSGLRVERHHHDEDERSDRMAAHDVERAILEDHEMTYLYNEGDMYYFMNTETYEQVGLSAEDLGDAVGYLLPETLINVEFYEGAPIGIEIPQVVVMTVVETEPEIKGATVSNVGKSAKLETGITIQVPAFIKEGEKIRVDTTEGRYIERAK